MSANSSTSKSRFISQIFKSTIQRRAVQTEIQADFSRRVRCVLFFPWGQRSEECQHPSTAPESVCGVQTAGSHQKVCYRVTQAIKTPTPWQRVNALSFPWIASRFRFNDSVQRQNRTESDWSFSCRRFTNVPIFAPLSQCVGAISDDLMSWLSFSFQAASEKHH